MNIYLKIIINAIGIGGGQLLFYIATPHLTKIFNVAEFGEYSLILAYSALLSSIISLRYDAAILMTSGEQTKKLLHGVVFVSSTVAFVSWIGIQLYAKTQGVNCANTAFYDLIFVCGFAGALFNINGSLYLNQERYLALAVIRVLQPLLMLFMILMRTFSLTEAWRNSWISVLIISYFGVYSSYNKLDISGSIKELRSFWIYPTRLAPLAALDTAASWIPVVVIGKYYGNSVIGNYSQIHRLIAGPVLLLIAASGQVVLQLAKKQIEKNESLRSIINIFSFLGLVIGLFYILVVWCFGEILLGKALTGEWRTDTNYVILILLPSIFRLVVSPLSGLLLVVRQYDAVIVWQTVHFVLTLSNGLLHSKNSTVDSYLVKTAILDIFSYTMYYAVILKASGVSKVREQS